MAGVTLDQLPPALALNGGELFWIYQQGPTAVTPWIGLACTSSQIAAYVNAISGGTTAGGVSMRQLFAALAADGLMVTAFNQLPSDITNSYNIAWNHAYRMTITDPFITGFLQNAIGYSGPQMTALFAQALTFPV